MNSPFRLTVLLGALILFLFSQGIFQGNAAQATPPPTNTPRGDVSSGPIPTNTKNASPSRTPTDSRTPTNTKSPTNTKTPTITKTPTNTPTLPPTMVILGTYTTPVDTPVTPIPPAAATPVTSGDDIVNVLLLGSDTITPGAAARTDVIILLSIDRTTNTVNMLHLPRDLYVYAPNYTMAKINTIMNYGNTKYGDGGGAKLIEDTILYNFGIKINFYARVDFVNFEKLINTLGGLDISVDCAIQGNRLKSPELDVTKAENYELYTLPVGAHHLSAYMSLWYVRSRGSSSDFARGDRQIDVLRAMWREAKNAGLFAQITTLWPEVQQLVETDMTLQDILGLAPIALNVDFTNIQRIAVDQTKDFKQWYTGDVGQYALSPVPERWKTIIQNFMLPPSKNRLGGEQTTVEIGAAQPISGYDQVAGDDLSWQGFSVNVIGTKGVVNRDQTVIFDYTGGTKPSSLATLLKTLRVKKTAVVSKPDPNRTVDFRVEMGRDYSNCIYALPAQYQDTPTPGQ